MPSFPSPSITATRLDLREYRLADAALVREVAANTGVEALPPGAPADPGLLADWLAAGDHRPPQDRTSLHLRVAEKAGFRLEGTLRRAGLEDDGLHDLMIYSLLDDEA